MARPPTDIFDPAFIARLEPLHLIAKRLAARGPAGARRSRRIGDGLEFADYRMYAPGDDIRFIDWPYYARMERLLLRLFHEHSEAGVAILLDASASMAGPGLAKFAYALRAAAALAYVAMGSLERVGLYPFAAALGEPFDAGRNRQQVLPMLDWLRGLTPGGTTDLARSVRALTRRTRLPGTVVLVSDLLDCHEDLSEACATLRHRGCDVMVLHVYSPDDARPRSLGALTLQQAETLERLDLQASPQLLESYARQWDRMVEGCRRACLQRGATYVEARTDTPFDELILVTLRRAGIVAG